MTDHFTCQANISGGFISAPARCSNRATVVEEGRHLCGVHSKAGKARRAALIAQKRQVAKMREVRAHKMNTWMHECVSFVEKMAEETTVGAMKNWIVSAKKLVRRKP